MNKEQLFVRTLQDLDTKLSSKDEYEWIKVAGLLRLLLLDRHPLVYQVKRPRRIKIKFTINDYPDSLLKPQPSLVVSSVEDFLDPNVIPRPNRVEVTKDRFISRRVMVVGDHFYTVKDIIRHVAHIQGGVHAGDPQDQKEEALRMLVQVFGIAGAPVGLHMLSVIGRIVRNGLEPLRAAIIGNEGNSEGSNENRSYLSPRIN